MEDHKLSLYDNIAKVNAVDPELYERYPVKRGLRNSDGSGVIAGVTNVSNVHGYLMNEGDKVPDEGKLHLPWLQHLRSCWRRCHQASRL